MASNKHSVGKISDFENRPMIGLTVDDTEILIIHANGEFFALEDRCSHADFKLSDGECTTGTVTCPAHGAQFCIKTGKALCMPAISPVKTFPISLVGDEIFVDLSDVAG